MNKNQHLQNLVYHKYYGRNYYGIKPNNCMPRVESTPTDSEKATRRSVIFGGIGLPKSLVLESIPSLTESVTTSDLVAWFSAVKNQLDSMINDVYQNDDEISEILRNINAEFEIHFPRNNESVESIREKMEDLYRTLRDFIERTEGSLSQYLTTLSDTVKAVSVDEIEAIEQSSEDEPSLENDGNTPNINKKMPNEEFDEDAFDFEKELEAI